MDGPTQRRTEQLGVRLTPGERDRVWRAAMIDNRTVSDWGRIALLEAADAVIGDQCSACGGDGVVPDRHPMDPDARDLPCPKCRPDPRKYL